MDGINLRVDTRQGAMPIRAIRFFAKRPSRQIMIPVMIRSIFAMMLMALILPAAALADAPTSRPSVKIAVLPFDVQGTSGQDWIGRAMQEGLATGLQNQPGVQAVIVSGIAPM